MHLLDHIERAVERVVEGGPGWVFRVPVRPATLVREIELAMTAGLLEARDRPPVAPNVFRVQMHPDDIAHYRGYRDTLADQLAYAVVECAREHGWRLAGPPVVDLVGAAGRTRRQVVVVAWSDPNAAAERTVQTPRLLVLNGPQQGQVLLPRAGVNVIGRDAGCDIVLLGDGVSRRHAWLEIGRIMELRDLESTNGARCNGQPVTRTVVHSGDTLEFGPIQTRLIAGSAAPSTVEGRG